MKRRALQVALVASLLAVAGYAAAALLAGAGHAAGPVLEASVGPGFTISLTQGGSPVTSLAPGDYTVNVTDSDTFHSFHLQGTGVDEKTTIAGTGSTTWNLTFTAGTYVFFCDAHQFTMRGSFDVGAATSTSSTTSATSTTSTTSTTTTAPTTTVAPTTTSTAPSTTSATPSTTTPTTSPGTTSSTTTTTEIEQVTTTAKPVAAVQSLRVVVKGRRSARVVLVSIDLRNPGAVRVRLLRGTRVRASLRVRVGARPTTLRLRVPLAAPAGQYTLEVMAGTQRIRRTVTLRP